ncbi:hypothetical protein SAMN04488523_101414 [Sulfitobacter brevis]|uniref:Uncharacterized protein n=1 Tax=Sulfitobacter brevis TaxID=74348 RepID=A0A1I1TNU5_9RHOB|nr:hypothetical protein [Sulfitobacter brevis]SFD58858.1 hypothetical protein SAMN04488523_101414 [Sulfitobacter brevis]
MSSTKNRLRELERGNQRLEVHLTSMAFDTGDAANQSTRTAAFHCDGSEYQITRDQGEDAGVFTRRAEAEGMALAQADHPKAIILAPGSEDL